MLIFDILYNKLVVIRIYLFLPNNVLLKPEAFFKPWLGLGFKLGLRALRIGNAVAFNMLLTCVFGAGRIARCDSNISRRSLGPEPKLRFEKAPDVDVTKI